MADLVLRIPKGEALTYEEADANWSNLNDELAGAVMNSDYSQAHSILVQQSGTGSPTALQVANNTLLGRLSGGGSEIDALTASEVRGMINVADGATANSPDATLLARANHTGTQAQATVDGLVTDLATKQTALVSGTNIKTVNGNSLLGSGDVVIAGGGGGASPLIGWII